ncbi:MAG: DUF2461 domain-containing protein [Saprospiraceae bacterium]
MSYFTPDFLIFFQDLAANNNRDWFHANKKRYEKSVREPFKSFVQVLIDAASEYNADISQIVPKQAIFRIHRDIRFSKDKTPYKIQSTAIISPYGRSKMDAPSGFYLEITPEHFRIYGGMYMVSKDDLVKVRRAIVEKPEEFKKRYSETEFVKYFGEIQGEKNKRIPKEFKPHIETEALIANKQFYYFTEFDLDLLFDESVINTIMQRYQIMDKMSAFFRKAIE